MLSYNNFLQCSAEGDHYGLLYGVALDDADKYDHYCMMYNPKFQSMPLLKEDAVSILKFY